MRIVQRAPPFAKIVRALACRPLHLEPLATLHRDGLLRAICRLRREEERERGEDHSLQDLEQLGSISETALPVGARDEEQEARDDPDRRNDA